MIDPRWLLKAALFAIAAALVCAYGTLCLLVYQGQWQLVLHPVAGAPLMDGPLQQNVRFGAGETGQPQLAGVWAPAAEPAAGTPTILYLPDGTANLAQDAAALKQLHGLPVNVFGFDYRGFGASAAQPHPDQARMNDDAETAFNYLVNTLHVTPARIVPYGVGLGASLAAGLAARHAEIPAIILERPEADATGAALADSRGRLVPLRLLLHERFDLAGPLSTLKTPKLLLESGPSVSTASSDGLFATSRAATPPVMVVHLDGRDPRLNGLWRASVMRFLDEYLPVPPSGLGARQ